MNRLILALIALAFIVRLGFLALIVNGTPIDNDGTEYARAIQNLRDGLGFTGMRGTALVVFPPLYSLLIGFVSLLSGNEEIAGRIISIIAGALLPLPIFLIAKMFYGRNVALLAATITVFVPYFVGLSNAVLTDQSYVTLAIFGLYCAMRASRSHLRIDATLAGTCFGFAYLLRPEGLPEGIALATGLFVLSSRRASLRNATAMLGAFIIPFALLAAPYVAFTSFASGKLAFEDKSAINYLIGTRMRSGMSYLEAAQGIGDDLTPYGPELNDDVALPSPTLHERITFALSVLPGQVLALTHTLSARNVLTPLGVMFALIGFGRSWKGRQRTALNILTSILAVAMFLALLSVAHFWTRYAAPFVAIAIPSTAKGAFDVIVFALRSQRRHLSLRAAWPAATAVLAVWFSLCSYSDVRAALSLPPLEKQAGLWLNEYDRGSKTLMAASMIAGYYAHATVIQLPYANSSRTADAYVERKSPNYVELRVDPAQLGPSYLRDWIDHGIPDRRASLIYKTGVRSGAPVVEIYCWACEKRRRVVRSLAP